MITSLKATTRYVRKTGVDLTWTTFHRMFCDRVATRSNEQAEEIRANARTNEDNEMINMMYLADTIRYDIIPSLSGWLNYTVDQDKAHFFHKLDHETERRGGSGLDRLVVYKRTKDKLNALINSLSGRYGCDDNTDYLRWIYASTQQSLGPVMSHKVSPLSWIKALQASHDAVLDSASNVAWLFASRMASIYWGNDPNGNGDDFQERSLEQIKETFKIMHLGTVCLDECKRKFVSVNYEYKNETMNIDCAGEALFHDASDAIAGWYDRAFKDVLSHVITMDDSFERFFASMFGYNNIDKFAIARSYTKNDLV